MAITEVAYCTRADVQRALNIADSPRLNDRVDAAIMVGARDLEGQLHRRFYPEDKAVSFDMPDDEYLWLHENELSGTPTEILSGGSPMTVGTDVLLRPKSGPPYRWLEARYSGNVYWQSEDTTQNAIEITGTFGHPVREIVATELVGAITFSNSSIVVADSSRCGPGDLILIDDERILVSDCGQSATGATLSADLTAAKTGMQLTVSNGALINQGELLWIDGERMLVTSVAGNTVIVDRAVNGSALATHTSGTAIYAPRNLSVLRGELGTQAADHGDGSLVTLLQAPSLIQELNLAFAINNTMQALSGYAKPVGAGDSQRDPSGRSVADLLADALSAYGRQYRGRAI